jgi:hypothetical protein
MQFLLYLIGIIVLIILLFRFVLFLSSAVLNLLVGSHHSDAEYILNTGVVPQRWGKKTIAALGGKKLLKFVSIRKLSKIMSYFAHSPLVEDDEARENLVARLRNIKENWKKKDWKEIYPYD